MIDEQHFARAVELVCEKRFSDLQNQVDALSERIETHTHPVEGYRPYTVTAVAPHPATPAAQAVQVPEIPVMPERWELGWIKPIKDDQYQAMIWTDTRTGGNGGQYRRVVCESTDPWDALRAAIEQAKGGAE